MQAPESTIIFFCAYSRKKLLHHLPMHICQAITPSLVLEGQPLMVYAHEVQDRSLQVVDMDRVFHDVVAKLVCFTIDQPFFDPSTRHPKGKASGW